MHRDTLDQEDRMIASALRPMAAEARRTLEDHLTSDELVSYHRNELSEDDEENVRDHLALCPECARRGLDLAAFVEPELDLGEDVHPPSAVASEGWRTLRKELRVKRARSAPLTGILGLFGSLRFAYALAAIFLVTTLTLPWFLDGRRPQANFQIEDLHPSDGAQRDGTLTPAGRIAGGKGFALILNANPGEQPEGAGYRAEIIALEVPQSSVKWIDGLEPEPEGHFTIEIPGGWLAAGAYEIRIHAGDGSILAEYRLSVEGP